MRKIKIGFLIGCLALGMLGCKTTKQESTIRPDEAKTETLGENEFLAEVKEVQEEYVMVQALEGHIQNQEVQVWTGMLEEMPKLQEGDRVRVIDRGQMTMSIPPQVSAVKLIKVK